MRRVNSQRLSMSLLAICRRVPLPFLSTGCVSSRSSDWRAKQPPSSCMDPGQYFATQITVTPSSLAFPYFGFVIEAQCGATTIFVRVYSDQPGGITQQTAD